MSFVKGKSSTHWGFLINRFDDKFLVIERNISDFTPWEANFGC